MIAYALVDEDDYEALNQFKWHRNSNGYVGRSVRVIGGQLCVLLHRQITNAKHGQYVDHISHDILDNRKCNLRLCTNGENMRNRKSLQINNTSGYQGVSWSERDRVWSAYVYVDNMKQNCGDFDNPEEAAVARDAAAIRLHGEFVSLNFPKEQQ